VIFQCIEEKNEEKKFYYHATRTRNNDGLHEQEEYSIVPFIRNIIALFY